MVRNRQTPRLAVVALAAVLFGTVLIAASAAPVAAQDEKQELEVEYEYELDPETPEEVNVTLTLQNPDEVDGEVTVRLYNYLEKENLEEGSRRSRLHPVQGAETASVTYQKDLIVDFTRRNVSAIGDDGSWAVAETDYSRMYGEDDYQYEIAREDVAVDGTVLSEPHLDDEYILFGSADAHTASGDDANITVLGPRDEMREPPEFVSQRLADVSDEIEAGVFDDVTAFAVPSIDNASGVARGSSTHYTETGNSVRDGGNTWFHEYVHNTESVSTGPEMEWFTEAYADYGSHLYGLRAGYGSYRAYVTDMNGWDQDEPVVLANDAEWEADGVNAEYDQGSRVLAAIDYELRKASRENDSVDATIDDVVREMHARDEVTLDEFKTILEQEGTEDIATQAETWITTEHDEDVFEPRGINEFEELYVPAPELSEVDSSWDAVGIHSDAGHPADPIVLDEDASTLVVYTAETLHTVTIETTDGEHVTEVETDGEPYVTVDAAKLDRSTTYEVIIESEPTGAVTTQYVSTLDPVEGAVPRNIDHEDGLHRDISGDGSLTNSDVTAFFRNQHTPEMQAHPEAYDFDGDGDVGQSDVQQLFEEV